MDREQIVLCGDGLNSIGGGYAAAGVGSLEIIDVVTHTVWAIVFAMLSNTERTTVAFGGWWLKAKGLTSIAGILRNKLTFPQNIKEYSEQSRARAW